MQNKKETLEENKPTIRTPDSHDFTQGAIFPALVRFSLPVLGALFLQTKYGAVDMMVVGQFAGASDVSAVSTGSWLMGLVISFAVGISMGTTVLLGRRIGEGKPQEAGNIVGVSILLFAGIALLLTAATELFAVQIARIMQVPQEAFSATLQYVRICAGGTVFIVAYNVLGSIFRGIGDSKMPLITVSIACVCNIAGDLLLIGVFGLATAGAAIATVAAQAISVLISLLVIRRRTLPFQFHASQIRFDKARMASVFFLGLPIAFQDCLVTISFLAITAIVNSLGVIASAGVGVAEKLCSFIMLVPSAFGQTMAAFVAQNMGAGKPIRAKKALLYGVSASFAVGILMGYISFFHGDLLVAIFSRDSQVMEAATEYLKSYSIDCLLVSFLFCMTGYFNGREKTMFVMIQGILGAFCVRIPVSYLMSRLVPVSLFKVGLATPASSAVQITLCIIYFVILAKKDKGGR